VAGSQALFAKKIKKLFRNFKNVSKNQGLRIQKKLASAQTNAHTCPGTHIRARACTPARADTNGSDTQGSASDTADTENGHTGTGTHTRTDTGAHAELAQGCASAQEHTYTHTRARMQSWRKGGASQAMVG